MSGMNNCQNCGRDNEASSIFCRFCGTRFGNNPQPQRGSFDYGAPSPYSWKTDEFQTKAGVRPTAAGGFSSAPVALHGGNSPLSHTDPRVRCPFCTSLVIPRIERKISTAGWITFSLLLVFTVIFFWIGLLIKENVAYCPVCNARMS